MIDRSEETARETARDDTKQSWTAPEVSRLLAGDAENNPGDSHADGISTFS